MPRRRKPASPFRCFNSSPEVIRLAVLMYVKYPLSFRNVEDLLHERGIDICHETVRYWWNRFGTLFAGDIRRQQANQMRGFRQWRWHLDEMYVKVNGEMGTVRVNAPSGNCVKYACSAPSQNGGFSRFCKTRFRPQSALVVARAFTLTVPGNPIGLR